MPWAATACVVSHPGTGSTLCPRTIPGNGSGSCGRTRSLTQVSRLNTPATRLTGCPVRRASSATVHCVRFRSRYTATSRDIRALGCAPASSAAAPAPNRSRWKAPIRRRNAGLAA